MKDTFIQAYPEFIVKCEKMRKDGKALTEIWRTMLLDKTMSPERALRILQAIFDLDNKNLAEIKETAFDMATYRLMASQGVSDAELLGKIYSDTHRKSLAERLFLQIKEIHFLKLYSAWKLVEKDYTQLVKTELWTASDYVGGIPSEITKNPLNQFFTLSADVMDRWHIFGFLIDPSFDYLTLHFLIFTDELEFDWEADMNALEWYIFAYIGFDSETLAAFIEIARSYASRLNDADNSAATFSEIIGEDKETYQKQVYPATGDFYQQVIYPNAIKCPKTLLKLNYYTGRDEIFIKTFQVDEENNQINKKSLGILYLTKQGLEDFCRLLEASIS